MKFRSNLSFRAIKAKRLAHSLRKFNVRSISIYRFILVYLYYTNTAMQPYWNIVYTLCELVYGQLDPGEVADPELALGSVQTDASTRHNFPRDFNDVMKTMHLSGISTLELNV